MTEPFPCDCNVLQAEAALNAYVEEREKKAIEKAIELVKMKRTMFLTEADVANDMEQANRDVRVRDRLRDEIVADLEAELEAKHE